MKKKFILVLISVFLFLAGCNTGKSYLEDYTVSQPYTEDSTSPSASSRPGQAAACDRFAYLREGSHRQTSDANGLYHMKSQGNHYIIYYYDYDKRAEAPWCSKPECKHNSSQCTAYVKSGGGNGDEFIEYHNGKVYLMSYDDQGQYLEQFSPDGSSQERLVNVYPQDIQATKLWIGKFYNNQYYYAALDDSQTTHYYVVDLTKNAVPRQLCSMKNPEGLKTSFYFFVNDKGLYFYHGSGKTNEEAVPYELFQYDFSTGQVKLLLSTHKQVRLGVNDNVYYLLEGEGFFTLTDAGEHQLISSELFPGMDTSFSLYCNEKYIVFDNGPNPGPEAEDRKTYIYDPQEQILKTFSFPDEFNILINGKNHYPNTDPQMLLTAPCLGMDGNYVYFFQFLTFDMCLIDLSGMEQEGALGYMFMEQTFLTQEQ